MARELVILPRFKRDYRSARQHPEFEPETLDYIFEVMISGATLPEAFREHRLDKRGPNWAGLTECHLGGDLLIIYRVRREAVIFHRIGTSQTNSCGPPLSSRHLSRCIGANLSVECSATITAQLRELRRFCFWTIGPHFLDDFR